MTNPARALLLDRAAIGMSLLCLVHCLALPVLLVLIPSLAVLPIADEHFHLVLLYLVLPTSVVALFLGCRRHKNRTVLLWGLSGLAVLVLAAFAGHDLLGDAGERALTVLGALLVALGHLKNVRLGRRSASA